MKRFASLALALGLVASVTVDAHAADPKEWSLQKFRPVIHSLGGFTTEAARVSHALTVNAYMMLNYAGPLLQGANGDDIVDGFGTGDIVASIGVLDHLSAGFDVPIHFGARGTFLDGEEVSAAGVGDIRLSLKATAYKPMRLGPGIGLAVDFFLPTGSKGGYGREEGFVVMPKLLLDAILGNVHLMTNLFVLSRTESFTPDQTNIDFGDNLAISSEAGVQAAAAIFLGSPQFRMILEGRFASRLARFFEPENTQLELTWGLHWRHETGFAIGGGASFGVLSGYGDPDWRAFLTVGYQPGRLIPMPVEVKVTDTDGDGVLDDVDQCPRDPEDRDGFQDVDGCPDNDNDNDGILDVNDKCPFEAEDKDGDRDTDGCPDGDGDKDGIPDDKDGCPTLPEDIDGFEDADGCPDPDNDKDGLFDAKDKCSLDAEDKDGFQDGDGCPEPDNDGDGIKDADDKCPDAPEDIDGCQDEDGCPEAGRVCVTKEKIVISEKVFFKTGKAVILTKSYSLLDEVAKVIRDNPHIKLVEVQGHTDSQGSDAYNLKLSDARARAVYSYLIAKGVEPTRLTARGYGETMPIADNRTREGRAANRRVEFVILKQEAPK